LLQTANKHIRERNMADLQSLRQYDVAAATCELNTALVGLQQIQQVSLVIFYSEYHAKMAVFSQA